MVSYLTLLDKLFMLCALGHFSAQKLIHPFNVLLHVAPFMHALFPACLDVTSPVKQPRSPPPSPPPFLRSNLSLLCLVALENCVVRTTTLARHGGNLIRATDLRHPSTPSRTGPATLFCNDDCPSFPPHDPLVPQGFSVLTTRERQVCFNGVGNTHTFIDSYFAIFVTPVWVTGYLLFWNEARPATRSTLGYPCYPHVLPGVLLNPKATRMPAVAAVG